MHSPLACAIHATLSEAFPWLLTLLVLPSEPLPEPEDADLLVADVAPYPVVSLACPAQWGSFVGAVGRAEEVAAVLRIAGFVLRTSNFCVEVTDGPHA